ncbi:MAG TPA: DUF309 domain-containing protein [Isosphaeraceae bacterium]|jgi:hypothetical protein
MSPEEPLPPYAFVPGGPWPHPTSSPAGHAFGRPQVTAAPIVDDDWRRSADYLRGVALFNAGYYWEAHESWERLWHAHGRSGPTADLLKALIKLAAAGVKVRQGQPAGVASHALRAAALLERVRTRAGDRQLGLDLGAWIEVARGIAAEPPADPWPGARVVPVFAVQLDPA